MTRTARFSVKKWDATFDATLRSNLDRLGFSDRDLISSVNEIHHDAKGEWVVHNVTLRRLSNDKKEDIMNDLRSAGAEVTEIADERGPALIVKRGSRVYQRIGWTGK